MSGGFFLFENEALILHKPLVYFCPDLIIFTPADLTSLTFAGGLASVEKLQCTKSCETIEKGEMCEKPWDREMNKEKLENTVFCVTSRQKGGEVNFRVIRECLHYLCRHQPA